MKQQKHTLKSEVTTVAVSTRWCNGHWESKFVYCCHQL